MQSLVCCTDQLNPWSKADIHGRGLAAKMASMFQDGLMSWPKYFAPKILVACISSSPGPSQISERRTATYQ